MAEIRDTEGDPGTASLWLRRIIRVFITGVFSFISSRFEKNILLIAKLFEPKASSQAKNKTYDHLEGFS